MIVGQESQETRKGLVVDDELGLKVVTSNDVAHGAQCRN